MNTDQVVTARSPLPEKPVSPRKRILIAEDDANLRDVLTLLLEVDDYDILSAPDGEEALAMYMATRFDLVVTDGEMPRLDGSGLVRNLRRAGKDIPIIMVSGSLRDGVLEPAVAREISAALPKPFPADQLRAAVRFALHPGERESARGEWPEDADSWGAGGQHARSIQPPPLRSIRRKSPRLVKKGALRFDFILSLL